MWPQQTLSQAKGRTGEYYFQSFVSSKLKWLYHTVDQENDFGIDGHVEVVLDGNVTGFKVGVQLKHGNSYFKSKTDKGFIYRAEMKHLYYYSNQQPYPIYIIIMDDNFEEIFWTEFDLSKIKKSKTGNKWEIEVLKSNTLNDNFEQSIMKHNPIQENLEELIEYNLKYNEYLSITEYKLIEVSKFEVDTNDYSLIDDLISRISSSSKMLDNSRGSLEIFFSGYDENPKELYQIQEVNKWLANSIYEGIP